MVLDEVIVLSHLFAGLRELGGEGLDVSDLKEGSAAVSSSKDFIAIGVLFRLNDDRLSLFLHLDLLFLDEAFSKQGFGGFMRNYIGLMLLFAFLEAKVFSNGRDELFGIAKPSVVLDAVKAGGVFEFLRFHFLDFVFAVLECVGIKREIDG